MEEWVGTWAKAVDRFVDDEGVVEMLRETYVLSREFQVRDTAVRHSPARALTSAREDVRGLAALTCISVFDESQGWTPSPAARADVRRAMSRCRVRPPRPVLRTRSSTNYGFFHKVFHSPHAPSHPVGARVDAGTTRPHVRDAARRDRELGARGSSAPLSSRGQKPLQKASEL